MSAFDLATATIAETAELIRKRELSPLELTRATLDRIEELNPKLLSFTTITPEYALAKAAAAEADLAGGAYKGPLHGIPYTLKDVIATKDVRTTFGHPRLVDFAPAESATVHTRLEAAGAILVGKVYSQIGRGDGPVECYNPWDPSFTKSPGTSSSGSGGAVAASMGLLSMGTDTGGSVRHPAGMCNLVGMKATFGRISRFGVLAPSWRADQAGPLTKTVTDCALAMNVLAGYDPQDLISINEPTPDYSSFLGGDLKGVRIGVPTDRWLWEREVEDIEVLVREAVKVLAGLGAEIVEVSLAKAANCRPTSFAINRPEAAVYWTEKFGEEVLQGWHEIYPGVLQGRQATFTDFLHAQYTAAEIEQELVAALKQCDLLAFPTGSTHGDQADATTAIIRGKEVPARSRAVYLNGLASLTGYPAMSVPCGFAPSDGMPVGLQISGRRLEEGLMLQAAYAYEQATDWHKRFPAL